MREYSIPALAQIADNASVADIVFSRAASQPQAVVMRRRSDDGDWRDVTAETFRAEVTALAKGLIAAGVEPGDRIALMSRTRYEWTLIDYAILAAGAVTVPVYETSSAEQVEWILGNSAARAVFAESGQHAQLIDGLRDRLSRPGRDLDPRRPGRPARQRGRPGHQRRAGGPAPGRPHAPTTWPRSSTPRAPRASPRAAS